MQEEVYFTFDRGRATFFVVDGRTTKTDGPLLVDGNGGLQPQAQAIKAWFNRPEADAPTVFVFCYPVPVAANIGKIFKWSQSGSSGNRDDANDRIHADDRKWLLELFVQHFEGGKNPRHRLVILSGDVHYSGLQELRLGRENKEAFGYEIISSGLAQTEFNPGGYYVGAVSGRLRDLNSDILDRSRLWIQDRGIYRGPSFAELFISAPSENSAPRIGLVYYPAELSELTPRDGFKWTSYLLDSTSLNPATAPLISDKQTYPENHIAWWARWFPRQTTYSQLTQALENFWRSKRQPYQPENQAALEKK